MKTLTKTKIKFIVDNFYENNKIDLRKLGKLTSAEELHFLAQIYNWDYDINVLRKIVQSKHCDKATALMIFWRACPNDILKYSNEKEARYDADCFKLLQDIIRKYTADKFKTNGIAYDPKEDNIGEVLNKKDRKINRVFYSAVKGDKFPEYPWRKKETVKRTLVSQSEADGSVKINLKVHSVTLGRVSSARHTEKIICTNTRNIEKQIPFPTELWDNKYHYTPTTNSWSACFLLQIDSKCKITNIAFTVADNKLVLDSGNYLPALKFKLTKKIPDMTAAEIVVEVVYSVNRVVELTKEDLEIEKAVAEAMKAVNQKFGF